VALGSIPSGLFEHFFFLSFPIENLSVSCHDLAAGLFFSPQYLQSEEEVNS